MTYPKPQEAGGILLRHLVSELRRLTPEAPLPYVSDILIAVSGGTDSLALARGLARYGRRIVSPENIEILHVNHQWRGAASQSDAEWVTNWARESGLRVRVDTLAPPEDASEPGQSWEGLAHHARQACFETWLREHPGGWVLTAHHADDLFETLVWRWFGGSFAGQEAGIRDRNGRVLRPLLGLRKSLLEQFLKEEGLTPRIDSTNTDPRFLRSRLRAELTPRIESLFPGVVERLGSAARNRSISR